MYDTLEFKKNNLLWFINNHKRLKAMLDSHLLQPHPFAVSAALWEKLLGRAKYFVILRASQKPFTLTTSSKFKCLLPSLVVLAQAYHDPMLKLSIMTEQELNQIFGTLDSLIPLHEGIILFQGWVVTCRLNWAVLDKSWLCNNVSNPEPTSSLLHIWMPN